MKGVITVAILAFISSASLVDANWDKECENHPLGKRVNHPSTCEKFIVCIGHGQEMSCPHRTHFNKELEVCDWPERAGCEKGSPGPSPGPTPRPSPWEQYCKDKPAGKHVSHPNSCEKYISCIDNGREMICPGNTQFNEELQVCDWPERAGCKKGSSTPSPWEQYCKDKPLGKHVNHPETCEKYIVCIGKGQEMSCPHKTHFNKDLEVCDWPERAGCQNGSPGPAPGPWTEYCKEQPAGKHVSHPKSCEKYISCINNGQEMNCPQKTHFNEELQVCDWPERAGCKKGSSSPSPWEKYCKDKPLGKRVKHPDSCDKFIVCIGYGQEMICPAKTHFNEKLEACDHPERAGC